MSIMLLQINFNIGMSRAEHEKACEPLAAPIGATPGLRCKTWIVDKARHEAGGIYLFDDEASMQAYIQGSIVTAVASNPAFTNASLKSFDISEGLSAVTRAPLAERMPA